MVTTGIRKASCPPGTEERMPGILTGVITITQAATRAAVITAVVTPGDGAVHFAEDIYGHDARLQRALTRDGSDH